jgi:hypothetical protein
MGNLPILPAFQGGSPLDAVTKAQLIAAAPTLTEAQGRDLADISDATSFGDRLRKERYGTGAALGVVAGLALGVLLGRRKRR